MNEVAGLSLSSLFSHNKCWSLKIFNSSQNSTCVQATVRNQVIEMRILQPLPETSHLLQRLDQQWLKSFNHMIGTWFALSAFLLYTVEHGGARLKHSDRRSNVCTLTA